MQIEMGTSSPHVPGSIHERTHHRSSSKEALHIQWAHDKAKCPSPGDSHRSTSVRFLHLFIFWESEKRPFATSSQETNSGLGKDNCMGCHASTGTGVRLPAFHGVPKHLSYWGYQKCPRTGGLFTHAPRKAEVVLWNPVY